MLKSLLIKNYALIDELAVDFPNGLSILTGETGAGKSIIIDALGLILGERLSTEMIRSGSDRAIVEGVFSIAGNRKVRLLLEEHELEGSEELIARREVSSKGQGRCFLNDTPVTAALLKQVGDLLVDLHGQHDHQSLLRVETHIELLDEFGGLEGLVGEYQVAFAEMNRLLREREEFHRREQQLKERRDFSEFQMKEIDAVAPRAGEEEELETEHRILENAERLFGSTGQLYEMLYEGEHSVHDLLVVVRNQLEDLAGIDKQFQESAAECQSAVAIVRELAKFLQSYNGKVEFNPERLEEVRSRLGMLAGLKKKYGGSLESVLAHREKIGEEVQLAQNFDDIIRACDAKLAEQRRHCGRLAGRISAKRQEIARKVDRNIVAELNKLGMAHARFATVVRQVESTDGSGGGNEVPVGKHTVRLNDRGYDEVEFLISTNLGEEVKPLAKVASGGEISRIMLALKTILAKSDRLPVLIFDEIDVGVSGRVAQAVGIALKNLSGFHQVIAITHLPQIAGLADEHFMVFKTESQKRTTTSVRRLSLDERVREVAKLMSGAEVTEAGLKGARELMSIPRNS